VKTLPPSRSSAAQRAGDHRVVGGEKWILSSTRAQAPTRASRRPSRSSRATRPPDRRPEAGQGADASDALLAHQRERRRGPEAGREARIAREGRAEHERAAARHHPRARRCGSVAASSESRIGRLGQVVREIERRPRREIEGRRQDESPASEGPERGIAKWPSSPVASVGASADDRRPAIEEEGCAGWSRRRPDQGPARRSEIRTSIQRTTPETSPSSVITGPGRMLSRSRRSSVADAR